MDIIVAQDQVHLASIIGKEMQDHGNACSLNHVDISNITDLSNVFEDLPFVGDISQWNTSNVTLPLDDKPLRSRGG